MKVLLISHLFPNGVDRVSGIFVKEQVRFLKEKCQISVVAPTLWFPPLPGFGRWSRLNQIPLRESLEGVDVYHPRYLRFPRMVLPSLVWLSYLFALFRAAKKLKFDLIHAHFAYPDGFAGVLFARIVHKPVIITAHGSDINIYTERKILRRMIVWALSESNAVIAVSERLKRRIDRLGILSKRIKVIYNGIDLKTFRPIDRSVAISRKGLSEGKKRVLYIGRFVHQKGLKVLIEAMSSLRSSRDDVELILVGAKDGDEAEFAKMGERLGLTGKILFVGQVPLADVPWWLAVSDVFVLPSFSEGFPLTVIEALACGRPVVSTRCGGPEEILTEQTGLLVSTGDPQALANAIGYVLNYPERFDPEQIASYARRRFNLRRTSAQIMALYSSVMRDMPSLLYQSD
ncbi:MAG TPA: glycosyltransferase family 4 protein [Candidatus Latescibacteria bacterium]|nr:glycosyltransferase family 4 protein [Candidatus Latescibacterota bacterium]